MNYNKLTFVSLIQIPKEKKGKNVLMMRIFKIYFPQQPRQIYS